MCAQQGGGREGRGLSHTKVNAAQGLPESLYSVLHWVSLVCNPFTQRGAT